MGAVPRKVRIGILGASKIAPISLISTALARNDVEIRCIASRELSRARSFAERHHVPCVAENYDALLARTDLDVIHIGLPVSQHARWTIRSLKSGKAVLCEKPFALNATEARQMVAVAQKTGQPLLEAFHYIFHPVMRRVLEIVRGGTLGQLFEASADFKAMLPFNADEIRWRRELGGGSLLDFGCYPVHALRTIVGEEPVVSEVQSQELHGVDAAISAKLVFPSGVQARVCASMVSSEFSGRLILRGEKGTIEVSNFIVPHIGCTFKVFIGGRQHVEEVRETTTFAEQLQHVVDVVMGRSSPQTGGEDSIRNMAVLDAIRQAAEIAIHEPQGERSGRG